MMLILIKLSNTHCGAITELIVTLSLMWILVKYSDGTWKSENAGADTSYATR